MSKSLLTGERARGTELNAVVLSGCNVGEDRGEEYLRVERSSLNFADEGGEAGGELATVVLGGCHVE
jgi:hypothetical protein